MGFVCQVPDNRPGKISGNPKKWASADAWLRDLGNNLSAIGQAHFQKRRQKQRKLSEGLIRRHCNFLSHIDGSLAAIRMTIL
jgi:hypothetical protein